VRGAVRITSGLQVLDLSYNRFDGGSPASSPTSPTSSRSTSQLLARRRSMSMLNGMAIRTGHQNCRWAGTKLGLANSHVREQMRKDGIVQELGSNFRLIVVKEGSNLKAGGQAATRSPSRLVAIIFC